MNTRPKTYTIAAILQFVLSAVGVVTSIPLLSLGAAVFNQTTLGPPYVVILLGTITSAMGLVSAYGVWRNEKWGIILTIILNAINGLSALPGIVLAPSVGVKLFAGGGVVLCMIIIALLLSPRPNLAPTSNQTTRQ